jgi:hypothetical protein
MPNTDGKLSRAAQFQIRFFDSPVSTNRNQLHSEFITSSQEAAEERARALLPSLRARGVSGYRIEDITGRTVAIGPGVNDAT